MAPTTIQPYSPCTIAHDNLLDVIKYLAIKNIFLCDMAKARTEQQSIPSEIQLVRVTVHVVVITGTEPTTNRRYSPCAIARDNLLDVVKCLLI